ncbi:MAG: helix-turn-helix domain-containing protein [Anaeroplasmataceae bacterium]|nr:helix-turn-helix domain-containing protein [Anaeroplasmataceae bacterium]
MEFKEKIKKLRTDKGLSQEALASELLTSRSTIAKWESGIRIPTRQSFELIAQYFNVPIDELLDDKDTKKIVITTNDSVNKILWGTLCLSSILFTIIISMLFFFKIYGTYCIDLVGIFSDNGYIYITYSLMDMKNNPWWIVGLVFNGLFIIISILMFLFRNKRYKKIYIGIFITSLVLAVTFTIVAFLSGRFMVDLWLAKYFLLEV